MVAILINSHCIKRDKLILEKYSAVTEYAPYNEIRLHGENRQWYLLIVKKNNWEAICTKHKIDYYDTFSTNKIKLFFVKVTQCSPFCYPENKTLIGKTIQVMIDPVNDQYYLIYPPLPIQRLCHNDGDYSRKGYIYGIHVNDCHKIDIKDEKLIAKEWIQFKASLPKKPPFHLTLKSLQDLTTIISGQ